MERACDSGTERGLVWAPDRDRHVNRHKFRVGVHASSRSGSTLGSLSGSSRAVSKLQNLPEGFGSLTRSDLERERIRSVGVHRYAPVRVVDTRRLSASVCVALRHPPRWRSPGEWRAMAHPSRDVAGRGAPLTCPAMSRLTGSGGPGRLSGGGCSRCIVSS